MVVLEYTHSDYSIRISTSDISGAWLKFKGRVEAPDTYAKYQADPGGSLRLYDFSTAALSDAIPVEDWGAMRPVFFETNDYSISIRFKNLADGKEPHIMHPDRDVEAMFNYIPLEIGGILDSTLHFLNEPGRFDLNFTYENEDGIVKTAAFGFDVVSPKLDTKKDLNTIIQDIKAEYDDLVFRYLTLTVREYSLGKDANNDLIWLSIFKQIIEKYIVAVRYILHAPHFNDTPVVEYQKPDRIKRWTNPLAEQYGNDRVRDFDAAARKYYRTEQVDTTLNTLENRFVKYTIGRIAERLRSVLRRIQRENVSPSEITTLDDYAKQLEVLRRNSFFSPIGKFEGFRQESMVLQQRNGYAQIYRYWIMLQNGLALIDGDNAIGVQPVWKLYELWCFLEVKRMVEEVLGLDRHDPSDRDFISEDTTKAFDPFRGGDLTGSTTYTNKANNDRIEIGYQYTFENKVKDLGIRSMTVDQKPDIVMHIHKSGGFTLTYLFDAKYRVLGIDDENEVVAMDYPVEETINQMHRYRDSIYYERGNHNTFSKEVMGGYILFPGRLDEDKYLRMIENSDYEHLPYYLKSIEYVNIGAFPLLPKETSGLLLKSFLRRVIIEDDVHQQLDSSIPQKGLYYSYDDEGDSVIFACYKSNEHLEWIKSKLKYNLRLDKGRRGAVSLSNDFTHAKYLVLYAKGDKMSNIIYGLSGDSEVVTKDELLELGYPEPQGNIYLNLGLTDNVQPSLKERAFVLSDSMIDTEACIPQVVKYINMIPPEWTLAGPQDDAPLQ
jgi:hypothetical protein